MSKAAEQRLDIQVGGLPPPFQDYSRLIHPYLLHGTHLAVVSTEMVDCVSWHVYARPVAIVGQKLDVDLGTSHGQQYGMMKNRPTLYVLEII